MEPTYADSWFDMAQLCDMDLWVMKWRLAWPLFHGPVILSYILKTIYIILWEYESVWPTFNLKIKVGHCDLYPWSSDFALYLEDYLMYEQYYLGLWVSMTHSLTSK